MIDLSHHAKEKPWAELSNEEKAERLGHSWAVPRQFVQFVLELFDHINRVEARVAQLETALAYKEIEVDVKK